MTTIFTATATQVAVHQQFLRDLESATTLQRVADIRTLVNGARGGHRLTRHQYFNLCTVARQRAVQLGEPDAAKARTAIPDVDDSHLRCGCGKRMVIDHESTPDGVEVVHVCLGCGHREADAVLRPAPDMAAAIALAAAEVPGHLEPGELP